MGRTLTGFATHDHGCDAPENANTFADGDPSVETDIPTGTAGRLPHPRRSPNTHISKCAVRAALQGPPSLSLALTHHPHPHPEGTRSRGMPNSGPQSITCRSYYLSYCPYSHPMMLTPCLCSLCPSRSLPTAKSISAGRHREGRHQNKCEFW